MTIGALSQATKKNDLQWDRSSCCLATIAWIDKGRTPYHSLPLPPAPPLPARNQYDRLDVGDGRLAGRKHKNCWRGALLKSLFRSLPLTALLPCSSVIMAFPLTAAFIKVLFTKALFCIVCTPHFRAAAFPPKWLHSGWRWGNCSPLPQATGYPPLFLLSLITQV